MSSTVNVVRYSALVGGIFYGIVHRRSLQTRENIKKEEHEHHHKEKLITEAREAWRKKQTPSNTSGVITDPEDPNFDLEKAIAVWEKQV